jgi:hypothetical protein
MYHSIRPFNCGQILMNYYKIHIENSKQFFILFCLVKVLKIKKNYEMLKHTKSTKIIVDFFF